jgi:hypothetical protein
MSKPKPKAQIRPPSAHDVSAFVAQGDARPGPAAGPLVNKSTRRPDAPAARKGVVSRVRKGDLDRITAYLPVDLGVELRTRCAAGRLELSEAIAEAVRDWLAKKA